MKFYVELELTAGKSIDEARFDALADALYDLDASDPAISDTDLGTSLADGHATVSMTVEAEDQGAAAAMVVCATRAAIHAIGDATPGWETHRGILRVAPADVADRLFAEA
jgi:hypothetical protein